jgi:tetratricopeptide (TPR) repeat protein
LLGEYDEAFYHFDKAIKLNPNDYYFYYWRGRIYFEKRLYEFKIFLKSNVFLLPDEAYFYGWRGIAYYEKGDYDKAIECFTEAIELEPDEADFYYWRGRSYYEKKRYDEAIEDFTEAIRLEPNEAGFYWWRGRAYYEKADYGKAIEDFTKAIKLKPDDAYIYWWRGRARYRKGEHNESIQDFTEAIKLKPDDADFYGWRGGAYYEKGKYDEAIHDLTKAIELKPDMAGFYYLRGNAYYWKGEYEKAIKDFDKVLELNPSYKEAREAKKEVENLIEYKKKSLVKSGNGSSYEEARKAKKEVESSIESKKKSLIKSENGRKAFKVSVLLMLFLTSVPMLVILDKKDDWQQRFIETIKENQEKIRISQLPDNLSSLDEVIDYVIYQLPDHKIKGAALPRDTNDHFIIAYVSWLSWMIFLIIVFSSSSNGESRAILSSILSSLFTAILGILILLVIQWLALEIYKSGIWEALKMSRGRYFISNLILYFIGFSYYSALDPESGFIKSFVGFTCGVGLCEELVKLIPVIWLMKRAFKKGETLHLSEILLVGLASGVGFGIE